MSWSAWGTSLAIAALVLTPVVGHGQVIELAPAQPAPEAGVLFTETPLKKLVEELRDARKNAALVEVLQAETAAKEQQIQALRSQVTEMGKAATADQIEVAILRDRDARAQAYEARMMALIASQGQVLGRYEDLVQGYERRQAKDQERIEGLERRQLIMTIAGPILGVIGLLVGAALW